MRADTGFVVGYEEFSGFRCEFYVVAGTRHRLDGDLLVFDITGRFETLEN
jgi:hypothetical protein